MFQPRKLYWTADPSTGKAGGGTWHSQPAVVAVNGTTEAVLTADWLCLNSLGPHITPFDRWGKPMVKRGWGCLGSPSFPEHTAVPRFLAAAPAAIRPALEKVFRQPRAQDVTAASGGGGSPWWTTLATLPASPGPVCRLALTTAPDGPGRDQARPSGRWHLLQPQGAAGGVRCGWHPS